MKKSTLLVVVLLLAFTTLLNAQVGIGTTNPKALLHIEANDNVPDYQKGIILPKVSSLPTGSIEEGMFVFLDSDNDQEGIYFYNGSKWEKNDNAWRLGGNSIENGDFIGTTNQEDLKFIVDKKQRLKIGVSGDLVYENSNNNKLIEISNDGNYTINNANNNELIEIKNNGKITLPYTDLADIDSNKSIATKEYVDTNLASSSGGVLEEITEDGNTGYRINGSTNGANYGDIGNYATDLSASLGASSSRGATGDYAFASGVNLTASGDYSFAGGLGTTASGNYSIAMGSLSKASGILSMAYGQSTTASNDLATAFGDGTTASGRTSFASGFYTRASGDHSFAGGNNTFALGDQSFTFGNGVSATGNQSFATGFAVSASGPRAFASGFSTAARGSQSFAMGEGTNANSYGEVAMGSFNTNLTAASANGYNTTDRVLSVGIGINAAASADALEVFKDGTIYADELDVSEITDAKQLVTKEYVDSSGGGVLEEITENFQTGYRIKGSTNDANYGNIGNNAVDLSYSSSASSTLGATGSRSFAVGEDARASGIISTAIGKMAQATSTGAIAIGYNANSGGLYATAIGYDTQAPAYHSSSIGRSTIANSNYEVAVGGYNTSYSPVSTSSFQPADKAFVVGIGTGTSSRADGFEVFKSGKIYADELDVSEITDDKQLVTKEYVDTSLASGTGGVLEEITEGGNTGYRINGSTVPSSYYGDIGERAVDLSNSTNSGTYGATGNASFAVGQAIYSQSYCSIAMGYNCQSNAAYATAMGYQTKAWGSSSFGAGYQAGTSGTASISLGYKTLSNSWAEVALGANNTSLTAKNKTDFDPEDRVLVVGIGHNSSNRADGLEVFKNGKIYADELDVSEITEEKQLVTKEYVDYNFISSVNEDTSNEIINFSKGIRIENLEYNSINSVTGGELIYDKNFYNDTGYGTGSGSPKDTFTNDGGGLVIYNEDDSWSAVFDTRNIKYANIDTNNLKVQGNQVWHEGNLTSADVPYDNSDSSLTSTNVKDAIDELASTGGSGSGTYNVGDEYMGGVIFYLEPGGQHGMIVSIKEFSLAWGSKGVNRYTKQGLQSGERNTHRLIDYNNDVKEIYYSESGNYGGWHLPSINELSKLDLVITTVNNVLNGIGGATKIGDKGYWSSSENTKDESFVYEFHNNKVVSVDKNSTLNARAVKWF